jgi:hypothetical protein
MHLSTMGRIAYENWHAIPAHLRKDNYPLLSKPLKTRMEKVQQNRFLAERQPNIKSAAGLLRRIG